MIFPLVGLNMKPNVFLFTRDISHGSRIQCLLLHVKYRVPSAEGHTLLQTGLRYQTGTLKPNRHQPSTAAPAGQEEGTEKG